MSLLRRLRRRLGSLKRRLRERIRHSQTLARLWRRLMFRTTVIAITGSVGKTTCRELLTAMLKNHGAIHHTKNNENDMYSVPRTVLGLRPWHKFAVIELSAHGPGTLKATANIVRPDISIITSVALTHSREYNNIEDIAREKSELIRNLKRGGRVILNVDDPRIAAMQPLVAQVTKHPPITFGTSVDAAVRASNVSSNWPQRLALTINTQTPVSSFELTSNLVGEHWVNSLLAASTAALSVGVAPTEVQSAVAKLPPFRARMEPIKLPNGATAFSDSNASAVVFQAMNKVAQTANGQRKILVISDVNDVAEVQNRSRNRRRWTADVAADIYDIAIFVGQGHHHATKRATQLGMPATCVVGVESVWEASDWLKNHLKPTDLVFVKGQSFMHLRRIILEQFGPIGCRLESCSIRSDCDICNKLQPGFDLVAALKSN